MFFKRKEPNLNTTIGFSPYVEYYDTLDEYAKLLPHNNPKELSFKNAALKAVEDAKHVLMYMEKRTRHIVHGFPQHVYVSTEQNEWSAEALIKIGFKQESPSTVDTLEFRFPITPCYSDMSVEITRIDIKSGHENGHNSILKHFKTYFSTKFMNKMTLESITDDFYDTENSCTFLVRELNSQPHTMDYLREMLNTYACPEYYSYEDLAIDLAQIVKSGPYQPICKFIIDKGILTGLLLIYTNWKFLYGSFELTFRGRRRMSVNRGFNRGYVTTVDYGVNTYSEKPLKIDDIVSMIGKSIYLHPESYEEREKYEVNNND